MVQGVAVHHGREGGQLRDMVVGSRRQQGLLAAACSHLCRSGRPDRKLARLLISRLNCSSLYCPHPKGSKASLKERAVSRRVSVQIYEPVWDISYLNHSTGGPMHLRLVFIAWWQAWRKSLTVVLASLDECMWGKRRVTGNDLLALLKMFVKGHVRSISYYT